MPRIAQSAGIVPSGHPAAEATARASFGKQLLLTLFFLTIVLDFRRLEGDDNPFVMIMGIANVLLGAWYCAAYRYFTPRLYGWVAAFLLLVGLGALTGILYGREIYLVFAHAVPILSFLFAAIAVHSMSGDAEKRTAIGVILATGLIAAGAKLVWGFYYYERDLENVRYQIIAGSLPLLFAYGFAGIFSRDRAFASLISIFVAVSIAAISVTRTYVIVFGVSVLVCFYSYSKATSRLFGVLVTLVIVSILAVALTELFPEILGRWEYRISESEKFGFDLTAALRLAEGEFQLRRLWSDFTGLLFGFGHAAETGLAGDNVRLIGNLIDRRETESFGLGYGHNVYVGLLYVGGLVAGLPVMAAFFQLLGKGLRHARRTSASPVDRFLLIWGVSAFTGYLVYGMFAGTLGDRSLSFFFGVSAGLVLLGTEPARHVVNQVIRRGPGMDGARTPKQRRAAMAREGERPAHQAASGSFHPSLPQ